MLIPAVPRDGPAQDRTDPKGRDAFSDEARLLHPGDVHLQDPIAIPPDIPGRLPGSGRDDADIVPRLDELSEQVLIYAPLFDRPDRDQGEEDDVHKALRLLCPSYGSLHSASASGEG